MWSAECQKRSPSTSGVAVRVSGVYVCTLVAVPFPSHFATHQVCLWHIRVPVGVSRGPVEDRLVHDLQHNSVYVLLR